MGEIEISYLTNKKKESKFETSRCSHEISRESVSWNLACIDHYSAIWFVLLYLILWCLCLIWKSGTHDIFKVRIFNLKKTIFKSLLVLAIIHPDLWSKNLSLFICRVIWWILWTWVLFIYRSNTCAQQRGFESYLTFELN